MKIHEIQDSLRWSFKETDESGKEINELHL